MVSRGPRRRAGALTSSGKAATSTKLLGDAHPRHGVLVENCHASKMSCRRSTRAIPAAAREPRAYTRSLTYTLLGHQLRDGNGFNNGDTCRTPACLLPGSLKRRRHRSSGGASPVRAVHRQLCPQLRHHRDGQHRQPHEYLEELGSGQHIVSSATSSRPSTTAARAATLSALPAARDHRPQQPVRQLQPTGSNHFPAATRGTCPPATRRSPATSWT